MELVFTPQKVMFVFAICSRFGDRISSDLERMAGRTHSGSREGGSQKNSILELTVSD
jgi:hypothetical protein